MTDKWDEIIESSKSGNSVTLDVNAWLGKATLDACVLYSPFGWHELWTNRKFISKRIGAGAFDYDFGALDDTDNPLTKSYLNLMCDHTPLSSIFRGSHRADYLPDSLVSSPSGTPLGSSFSS